MGIVSNWAGAAALAAGMLTGAGATLAQEWSERGGAIDREGAPARSTLPADEVRVPMRLVNGRPVIEATINGVGPVPMIFDTGAGAVFLPRAFAQELDLAVEGESRVGVPGGPRRVEVQEHTLDSIEIGGARFERLDAMSHAERMMTAAMGEAKGVIGLPTFADCLVTLDYPAGELVIRRGALAADDGSVGYEIDEYGFPSIEIDVGGARIDSHIDSGSMSAITLPARLEKALPLQAPPRVIGRGRTASGEFEIRGATLDGAATIAGRAIADPELHFNDMFDHANLGTQVLSRFAVTIDQVNRRMLFEGPIGEGVAPRPVVRRGGSPGGEAGDRKTYGVMLGMSDRGPIEVHGTTPGSVAEQAGLEAGDLIVGMNGRDIDAFGFDQRAAAFRAPSITLTIQRDGERLKVEMMLER